MAQVLTRFTVEVGRHRRHPHPLRLCLAGATILDADGGAITLAYTRPERLTLCTTDDVAARLEDLQDVLGEGPGPAAFRSGRITATTVADESDRWPLFTRAALEAFGPLSVYALPVAGPSDVLGVFTLYQLPPRRLGEDDEVARFVADSIGASLLAQHEIVDLDADASWQVRSTVHQATGMVMSQLGVGEEDATAVLRAHAFAENTPLSEIARRVTSLEDDFGRLPHSIRPDDDAGRESS